MLPSALERRQEFATGWRDLSRRQRLRIRGCVVYLAALTLLFVGPLVQLVSMAFRDNLHSYIPLIPALSIYLLVVQPRPHVSAYSSSMTGTILLAPAAGALVVVALLFRESMSQNDYLVLMVLGYVGFIVTGTFLLMGSKWVAGAAFPIAFLVFMVPLPDVVAYWLERVSVLASADTAAFFFRLSGTPLLRDGTVLALPGIVLEVGQECSGIRSSWALFITSLLASYLFLESPWRRTALVLFVIPLAIARNAFRILVIGLLCVHAGPHMIDSAIHRRGGPLFFALSLVPLFLLLAWLRGRERRRKVQPA